MVEPSVYDELQGTIDLVTPSKKRRASSADSTASVAGSVSGAEPAKAAVLALQHGAQDRAYVLVLGCSSVTGPGKYRSMLRNAAAIQVMGQLQKLRAQTGGQ